MNSYDLSHLHPNVRAVAEHDNASRIEQIRSERWIDHAAATAVLEALQDIIMQPPSSRMENVLLLAESGMGKTAVLKKAMRAPHVKCGQILGIPSVPILFMTMPPSPTETEFFGEILKKLDAPGPAQGFRRRGLELRGAVFNVLREVGLKALIIDEINSVLAGTPRQQRLFLQLLRFLSNDLSIAFICAGVPEARHALLSDSQLRSRFTTVELPLWTPGAELQVFINRFVAGLPLRQPSPVDSARIRKLIATRSSGVTLFVAKALARAAIAAIRSQKEMIDLAGLEDDAVWKGNAS